MDHLDETTIGLFLEHRLPDEQVRGMVHHIDECDACRQLLAELGRGSVQIAEGSTLAAAGPPPGPFRARRTRTRGERIGRYVVIDLVGAGAMGAVYAAFDPDLDRKIAVKLLHTGAAATDDERTRMMREAQALARVSHAGVVAVHDVGTHDDRSARDQRPRDRAPRDRGHGQATGARRVQRSDPAQRGPTAAGGSRDHDRDRGDPARDRARSHP